eukprot:350697-Chlamydomonas_euryale.AAC.2
MAASSSAIFCERALPRIALGRMIDLTATVVLRHCPRYTCNRARRREQPHDTPAGGPVYRIGCAHACLPAGG